MTTDPTLPYPDHSGMNTGGWSGSATSRARAIHDVLSGAGRNRKDAILTLVRGSETVGMTTRELEAMTGLHHGAASGPLSNLQKAGLLARLTEQRMGNEVYVDPAFVRGRPVAPYRANRANRRDAGYEDGYAAGWQDGYIAAREGMPPEPPPLFGKTASGEVIPLDDDDEDLPPSLV